MTDRIVLLVEDEDLMRLTASEVLRGAGYTVIEAMHAQAAADSLGLRTAAVHVLLTDIHMPEDAWLGPCPPDEHALALDQITACIGPRSATGSGFASRQPFAPKPYMLVSCRLPIVISPTAVNKRETEV